MSAQSPPRGPNPEAEAFAKQMDRAERWTRWIGLVVGAGFAGATLVLVLVSHDYEPAVVTSFVAAVSLGRGFGAGKELGLLKCFRGQRGPPRR